MNKVYTSIAVGGIALAAAAAWWFQRPASPGSQAAAAASSSVAPASAAGPRGGGSGGGSGGVVSVEVARAEALSIVDDVQAVGSLKARQGVMVRPEVSGRIARLGFADGRPVRAGQLLVQLDDTLQRAQLEQAKRRRASRARTCSAAASCWRRLRQPERGRPERGGAAGGRSAGGAGRSAAGAHAHRRAASTAPRGCGLVDVGDYLKDGADIVKIEDLSALEVEFALPERYVARTRPGLAMELTLDAMPGAVFAGQVLALNSLVDANGRALTVRARVQNPGAVLKPGMFARPRIIFSRREGAVAVPEEALVPLGAKQ
ncbi:MAG: efflux RND transporter periplasmic adaptor subunit [Rubrivivax sp.]